MPTDTLDDYELQHVVVEAALAWVEAGQAFGEGTYEHDRAERSLAVFATALHRRRVSVSPGTVLRSSRVPPREPSTPAP